jgi:hypothetical protein
MMVLPNFTPDPQPGNPEHVILDPAWTRKYLVTVRVPQLQRLKVRAATCHFLAKEPLLDLFDAWERAGLLGLIHTWGGMYAPRFVRQRGTEAQRIAKCKTLGPLDLSNHALGLAFDINAPEHPLGSELPLEHPFRQLLPIAHDWGWTNGGVFTRRDFMHFEYT